MLMAFCAAATVNHPFMGTLPTSFGSASKHLERPGRAVTADFLRKVLKLGLLRLEDLCDRIDFKPMEKKDMLTQVDVNPDPPAPLCQQTFKIAEQVQPSLLATLIHSMKLKTSPRASAVVSRVAKLEQL